MAAVAQEGGIGVEAALGKGLPVGRIQDSVDTQTVGFCYCRVDEARVMDLHLDIAAHLEMGGEPQRVVFHENVADGRLGHWQADCRAFSASKGN